MGGKPHKDVGRPEEPQAEDVEELLADVDEDAPGYDHLKRTVIKLLATHNSQKRLAARKLVRATQLKAEGKPYMAAELRKEAEKLLSE
jgi:hypothetical protein